MSSRRTWHPSEVIERELRRRGEPDRAAGAKAYLKSDLEFIGVKAADLRSVLSSVIPSDTPLDRRQLLAVVDGLWSRPVFELRVAAAELLVRHLQLLEADDLAMVERMVRQAKTWALVDLLGPRVVGPFVDRHPQLVAVLDRWAADDDFWVRRAALLSHLLPLRRGEGDFERFGRYADTMLDDREFFIRKAIGWVLREAGKKRPELVLQWLTPRVARASGVTLREAVKYLDAADRQRLMRASGR